MARLSVAPQVQNLQRNLVPHPPLEDERRPLPSWGEAEMGYLRVADFYQEIADELVEHGGILEIDRMTAAGHCAQS